MEEGGLIPRELTEQDIGEYIKDFAEGAKNAIAAGMDGVELHGANGYLIDQFIQESCNQRIDQWGGSIEKRARFALEVAKAVSTAIGPERVGIKLNPWGKNQGMGTMTDLYSQFEYLISSLGRMNLAYLHLENPRWYDETLAGKEGNGLFVRKWVGSGPIFLGGGYDCSSAKKEVDVVYEGFDVGISFGRFFVSNPDLPFRVKTEVEFQKYNRDTFYTPMSPKGYVDYPFSPEFLVTRKTLI
jgi:NADPH2 dehydrogenase/chanoclavine-I aldehyde reductase